MYACYAFLRDSAIIYTESQGPRLVKAPFGSFLYSGTHFALQSYT